MPNCYSYMSMKPSPQYCCGQMGETRGRLWTWQARKSHSEWEGLVMTCVRLAPGQSWAMELQWKVKGPACCVVGLEWIDTYIHTYIRVCRLGCIWHVYCVCIDRSDWMTEDSNEDNEWFSKCCTEKVLILIILSASLPSFLPSFLPSPSISPSPLSPSPHPPTHNYWPVQWSAEDRQENVLHVWCGTVGELHRRHEQWM